MSRARTSPKRVSQRPLLALHLYFYTKCRSAAYFRNSVPLTHQHLPVMETPESIVDMPAPRRKTFPRKGHTKSRKGCYNCKRRKIKCQETRPSCSNCEKADLQCQYPDVASRWASMAGALVVQPTASPTVFSLEDMHFFHHFMVRAYPHLPVGADSLWQSSIPAFAHQVRSAHLTPLLRVWR